MFLLLWLLIIILSLLLLARGSTRAPVGGAVTSQKTSPSKDRRCRTDEGVPSRQSVFFHLFKLLLLLLFFTIKHSTFKNLQIYQFVCPYETLSSTADTDR